MKTYTVYFSEPVCHKYIGDKFNQELKKWEYNVECEDWNDTFTFYSIVFDSIEDCGSIGIMIPYKS